MRPEIISGEVLAARIAKAFEAALAADVYAVLHLNRQIDGYRGDRQLYKNEALAFMVRLARRVRGKSLYRRCPPNRRFLANAITIEKLGDGPHLNILIRKPRHWEFDAFREVFVEEWLKTPWAATDPKAVYCQPREPGSDLAGYCHKEGDEALVHETLSF